MISVILPVYHNEIALQENISWLEGITQITEKILVFDGYQPPDPFNDDLWRNFNGVRTIANYPDVPWGNARARNLGAINATREWFIFLDVDHTFKKKIYDREIQKLSRRAVHRFKRTHGGITTWPSGSILIHRDLFFKVGGYDERFCGNYGYEDLHLIWKVGKQKNTEIEIDVIQNGAVKLERDSSINKTLFENIKDGF